MTLFFTKLDLPPLQFAVVTFGSILAWLSILFIFINFSVLVLMSILSAYPFSEEENESDKKIKGLSEKLPRVWVFTAFIQLITIVSTLVVYIIRGFMTAGM